MTSIIEKFDAAFDKAIQNPTNFFQNGHINFDYIEADVWLDLGKDYDRAEILKVMDSEFNFAASEWSHNTLNDVKEHFAA